MSGNLEVRIAADRKRLAELQRRAEEEARRERERRRRAEELAQAKRSALAIEGELQASLRGVTPAIAQHAQDAAGRLRAGVEGATDPTAIGALILSARKATAAALAAEGGATPTLLKDANEALAFLDACDEIQVPVLPEQADARERLRGFVRDPIKLGVGVCEAALRDARPGSLNLAFQVRRDSIAGTFHALTAGTWPDELRAWDPSLPERVEKALKAVLANCMEGTSAVVADVNAFFGEWALVQIERLLESARAGGFRVVEPRYDPATRTYLASLRDDKGATFNVSQAVPEVGASERRGLWTSGPSNWDAHACTVHGLRQATTKMCQEGVEMGVFNERGEQVPMDPVSTSTAPVGVAQTGGSAPKRRAEKLSE
jgi:hypothetical protein